MAVKTLLDQNYNGRSNLSPYVDTASSLIDQCVSVAARRGLDPISSHTQELMERWLACWAYTQMDPLYVSKSTLSSSGSFVQQDYRAVAVSLDPTGVLLAILNNLNKGAVGCFHLGSSYSEQVARARARDGG
jgi:hypothetical protein